MLTKKTLNSLRINLFFKGSILTLTLILYFIFINIFQPYLQNSNDYPKSSITEITNIFSIIFLCVILLITGSLIFTIMNTIKLKSSSDSDIDKQINPQLPQTQNITHYDKSQAEKIKNDRLYTMGSLAAGIIHDFKNPISNISLCVQAIMNGLAEGDKRDLYLRKIEDQIDRMVNMTQDFLDYAQGQKSLKMQEVEFTQTIKNQIEFHRERSKKKNISLKYSLPEPFHIKIDIHKFRRVLDNIIINAFEVLKPGHSINIDILINESGFKMKIEDDGPGISPNVLPKIFEPFFTHGKSKGSGLGLSISKKIIEDHGGNLSVHSELDKGTCFTITLPSHLINKKTTKPISMHTEVIAY